MKSLLKSLLESTGYRISKIPEKEAHVPYDRDGLRSIHNHEFMDDPAFRAAYDRATLTLDPGENYGIQWRVHVALWAANYAAQLPGDFIECGVNKGFVSSAILHNLNWNDLDKTFFLLDSFAGLDPESSTAKDLSSSEKRIESGFYTNDLDRVTANFSEWERVQLVPGFLPATAAEITSTKIAFIHLDLNAPTPEKETLERLWDRIVPSGVILLDDYAYYGYDASKEAIDSVAKKKGTSVLSLPTGQGLLLK